MATSSNVLQKIYILGSGTAASAALLAQLEAMVEADDGGYHLVAQAVEAYMDQQVAQNGLVATLQSLAFNGLGLVLDEDEVKATMDSLLASGVDTWAELFELCIGLQGDMGAVLDHRAEAADAFCAYLESHGEADLYQGAEVEAAVRDILQDVDSTDASLEAAIQALAALAQGLIDANTPPVPPPPPTVDPPPFKVSVKAGVVGFGGSLTGDITIAWSGAPGASVATFTRGGFVAANTPDFSTTAVAITLRAGQNLAANAADLGAIPISGPGTITLLDTTISASTLNALDAASTAVIGAAAVVSLTGAAADVVTAYAANTAGTITGLGNEIVTLAGNTAVADANTVDGQTTGVITATLTEGALATLSGLEGTGNAYTVTVTDTTAAAAALTALDGKTTVAVGAAAVTTLTGTVTETVAAYAANSATTITGLGDEAVTLSGSTSVADANTVDGLTTGAVTATITEGALATLATLTGTGNAYTITVTDTSAAAANLATVDGKTTVAVGAAAVTTLTGTAAEAIAAYAANTATTITGLGDEAVTVSGGATVVQANSIAGTTSGIVTAGITNGNLSTLVTLAETTNAYTVTVTDATAAAANLTTVDGKTTVAVGAAAVTTLTGTAAEVIAAYAANTAGTITGLGDETVTLSGSTAVADANTVDGKTTGAIAATITEGTLATLVTLSGTGNGYTVTVTDTTAAAANLTTVDGKTTVAVGAAAVTTLTGTAAEVIAAYAANTATTITGLGNEAVTVSGTPSVTDTNTIDAATTGVITATLASDTAANLATLTGTGNAYTVTVLAGSAAAAHLNTIDARTTVTANATAVTAITGTAADIAIAVSATGIDTAANVATTVDAGSVAAAALNIIDANTTVVVNATAVTALIGTSAAIATALGATGIDLPGDLGITVSGAALASDLIAIDNATTTTVDASGVTTITGSAADINAVIAAPGITRSGTYNAVVTDTISIATANAINADSVGSITATVTADTAANLLGLAGTGNAYTLTVTSTTVAAADLNAIDAKTTVVVDATAMTHISGTAAAVATALSSGGINHAGNVIVDGLSGSVLASDLKLIGNNTSHTVDVTGVTEITGTALQLGLGSGFSTSGTQNLVATDTLSVAEADFLDDQTSGVVTGTLEQALLSDLTALTGTNNAYTIVLAEVTADAGELNFVNAATTVNVDATNLYNVSGTPAEFVTLLSSTGIDYGSPFPALTIDAGSFDAADLLDVDLLHPSMIVGSNITAVTGTGADISSLLLDEGLGIDLSTSLDFSASGATDLEAQVIFQFTTSGTTHVELLGGSVGGTYPMASGDSVDLDPTGTMTALTVNTGDASTVNAAGEYAYAGGLFTWWDSAHSELGSFAITGAPGISVLGDLVTVL